MRIAIVAGGGSTDYGHAFQDFKRLCQDDLDKRTTIHHPGRQPLLPFFASDPVLRPDTPPPPMNSVECVEFRVLGKRITEYLEANAAPPDEIGVASLHGAKGYFLPPEPVFGGLEGGLAGAASLVVG